MVSGCERFELFSRLTAACHHYFLWLKYQVQPHIVIKRGRKTGVRAEQSRADMWDECTSVLRKNQHNLFILRNSVRILPAMAWTLYLLPDTERKPFFYVSYVRWKLSWSLICGIRLSRSGIIWFLSTEPVFYIFLLSLLFCIIIYNGLVIALISWFISVRCEGINRVVPLQLYKVTTATPCVLGK